jgi:hypothetical protein
MLKVHLLTFSVQNYEKQWVKLLIFENAVFRLYAKLVLL